MDDSKRLVYSIVKFLRSQVESGELPSDGCEGIEVSIQCLESAYNISSDDKQLDVPLPLQTIFTNYLKETDQTLPEAHPLSEEDKILAEEMKVEGNNLMSSENFKAAIEYYNKAIAIDSRNAVYYCNRAAAYTKLNDHESAIQDCKNALKIDPQYSKAYGRLGLAYSMLNRHQEAYDSYKRALELEPDNEGYHSNLQLSAAKISTTTSETRRPPMDFGMLFSNPELVNMATQMLSNPSMQSLMNNVMSGGLAQNPNNMESLMQVTQQLAQQLQTENPTLVEELKRKFNGPNSQQPPDGDATS
ncbi:small glutamine-rich tetratricopeptide repeat-containing protein alpha-like [Nilaparvata lugens]|uniref:small glutamine-rich tetratricopeptide repeat-containing protein alpha-like n=1 Tax=Nilaparvata lugens TaxID=108931 RepID=UPI00193DAC85|nr:small glutamine-rich tetratricopeptide repeat-containing protein alpha-like [Nilaparvata lugens]